jgi:hypothetical protein
MENVYVVVETDARDRHLDPVQRVAFKDRDEAYKHAEYQTSWMRGIGQGHVRYSVACVALIESMEGK